VVAAGLMAGKRPDALPAPMSELETPFRFGRGPSGTVLPIGTVVLTGVLEDDDAAGEAWAAMTATVSCAAGGVHFSGVTTLAVAVSVTEPTFVAPAATGIWACRVTALVSGTEPTVQFAVLSPLVQPLVNAGFWLAGAEFRATDTPAAEPFLVETVTTKVASCPRCTLDCARWTLAQSSGWAALELGLALALAFAAVPALELACAAGLGLAVM